MKNIEKQGKKQEVETMMKLVGALSRVKLDFRRKVFKDIHQALGGKLRIIVNGAATLDKEVEKGFNALGFRVKRLTRVRFGDIDTKDIPEGGVKELSIHQIKRLYALANGGEE